MQLFSDRRWGVQVGSLLAEGRWLGILAQSPPEATSCSPRARAGGRWFLFLYFVSRHFHVPGFPTCKIRSVHLHCLPQPQAHPSRDQRRNM